MASWLNKPRLCERCRMKFVAANVSVDRKWELFRPTGNASVKDRGKLCDTPSDPSLEFDTFEYMRRRLTNAFIEGGHDALEAAKIALYVVQGVRHVPKLLRIFTVEKPPTLDEILDALGPVLDETPALEKARQLLLQLDNEDQA